MRLTKLPPGRFLVQFAPQSQKEGLIFIPSRVRSLRRAETAIVLMKGDPVPRNGQMYDIPITEGELVWVHPQYGDQWEPESEVSGEIRSYDFNDYRGTVDPNDQEAS